MTTVVATPVGLVDRSATLRPAYPIRNVFLEERGTCCSAEDDDCVEGDEDVIDDGPTADGTAGLGVEFETGQIRIVPAGTCSESDVAALSICWAVT